MILPSEFNVRWHMQFKDINDDTYHLCIYDKNYNGVVQTLRGGATPFVIEEDDDDDVFLPIRTQTGLITFVDNGTIVEQMLSDTPLNRPVILYKGAMEYGNEQWTGFLSCESMSQPYADSIHTVSVGVQCPLATLQGIEIDQPQYGIGLGFVNLNILIHEALRHVYDLDVKEQPYDDWGSGAWQYYVLRDYWLERVDYDSTIQNPYTGRTYYDVFTDIFMYFGLQARMHNGDVYITKTDCADFGNDIITPEWMGTGHEQNFLAGVRKITQECMPDEADTEIASIPDDEFHLYDEGPEEGTKVSAPFITRTEERWCQPGVTNDTWYAYSIASGRIPPIKGQLRTQNPDQPVMYGGIFEEYGVVNYLIGAESPDIEMEKGMMFAINSGRAFAFRSIGGVFSVPGKNTLRISMKGAFIRSPYMIKEKTNGTGLVTSIRFSISFGNKYLKRVNPGEATEGYTWITDTLSYYDAYIDAAGKLCMNENETTHLAIKDDIVVQLPNGCEPLYIDIQAPTTEGRFQYFFATDFSVSIDTMDKQKRRRHILRYDLGNAFSDTVDMELPLACNLSQVPYTHGYIFRKDPQGEYRIMSDYYENDLFERLKNYYSTRHHTLVITVSINDYRPDYGVVINGVIYAVLAHTYDYINATVTLKLINIPQPE